MRRKSAKYKIVNVYQCFDTLLPVGDSKGIWPVGNLCCLSRRVAPCGFRAV